MLIGMRVLCQDTIPELKNGKHTTVNSGDPFDAVVVFAGVTRYGTFVVLRMDDGQLITRSVGNGCRMADITRPD